MDTTKNLRVIITADTTGASAAMGALETQTASFSTRLKSLGSDLSSAGRSLTTSLTVPIVGIAAATAKMATSFQQDMTYVRTQAGDTVDSIATLSAQVLDLAKKSQFSPDELANGLYHLASLGLRGADAMNALNTAQQLAAVGGSNLEDTTSALGAALVTGIKGTQDYSEAAGTLNAIIGQGNMRMGDLVNALGSGILPVAKNAGLTLQDVGAALATLTDNGMQADEAATRLRMTFALMEAPSTKAQKQLEDIGMSSNQLALDMRTKGLIPALSDLKQHLLDTYGTTAEGQTKMAAALTEIFGGGRSSAAAQTLIEQLTRVQTKYSAIAETTGQFATDVAQQQETASAKIKTAWSTIQVDAIEVGSKILPALASAFTSLSNAIDKVATWYTNLSTGQRRVVNDLLMLLATLGPVLLILGKFATAISAIITVGADLMPLFRLIVVGLGLLADGFIAVQVAIGPIGWLIEGIAVIVAAATYEIVQHWDTVKKWLSDFWNWLGNNIGTLIGILFGPFGTAIDMIVSHWNGLIAFFQGIPAAIVNAIGYLGNLLYNSGRDLLNGLLRGVKDAVGSVGSAISGVLHAIHIPGFASGTNYAPGGMAIVGENGPELVNLPRGSQVYNNSDTKNMVSNRTVTIGTVILNSADAVKEMFKYLDQDNINVTRGLTPNRGMA